MQRRYIKNIDVTQGIGKIPGKYSLKYDENVQPVAHPPCPIAAALGDPTKKKLVRLEEMDIIKKVPVGAPTPWSSALHVVHKKTCHLTKMLG